MPSLNPHRRSGGLRWRVPVESVVRNCLWCQAEIQAPRVTCSEQCLHEYRLRHEPSYFREQVFLRDKGICATCELDIVAIYNQIQQLPEQERQRLWKLHEIPPHRRNGPAWDLDHIVEVVDGGGMCGLDNAQTLCCSCHKKKTARLATARAMQRRLRPKVVRAESLEDF